jgi:hypothetical protein
VISQDILLSLALYEATRDICQSCYRETRGRNTIELSINQSWSNLSPLDQCVCVSAFD